MAEFDWGDPSLVALDAALRCAICAELLSSAAAGFPDVCGHTFCSLCARTSLRDKPHCPQCRAPVKQSDLKPNRALERVAALFEASRGPLLRAWLAHVSGKAEGSAPLPAASTAATRASTFTKCRICQARMPTLPAGAATAHEAACAAASRSAGIPSAHSLGAGSGGSAATKHIAGKVLNLLKDADLRRELVSFGLSSDGRRPDLERRYRTFIDMHNAQVGALRPASHAEVLRRVRESESDRRGGIGGAGTVAAIFGSARAATAAGSGDLPTSVTTGAETASVALTGSSTAAISSSEGLQGDAAMVVVSDDDGVGDLPSLPLEQAPLNTRHRQQQQMCSQRVPWNVTKFPAGRILRSFVTHGASKHDSDRSFSPQLSFAWEGPALPAAMRKSAVLEHWRQLAHCIRQRPPSTTMPPRSPPSQLPLSMSSPPPAGFRRAPAGGTGPVPEGIVGEGLRASRLLPPDWTVLLVPQSAPPPLPMTGSDATPAADKLVLFYFNKRTGAGQFVAPVTDSSEGTSDAASATGARTGLPPETAQADALATKSPSSGTSASALAVSLPAVAATGHAAAGEVEATRRVVSSAKRRRTESYEATIGAVPVPSSAHASAASAAASSASVDPGSAAAGGWQCPGCTFVNRSRLRKCEICRTAKPSQAVTGSSVAPPIPEAADAAAASSAAPGVVAV